MSEHESKSLREKIISMQNWIEDQVTLGLVDLEKTPAGFDRHRYALNKLSSETNTLTTTCFHCSKPLTAKRVTSDHVKWFCNESCMVAYDKAEGEALRRKEHD